MRVEEAAGSGPAVHVRRRARCSGDAYHLLTDTRVGRMVPVPLGPRERWRGDDDREEDREGEQGGPSRHRMYFFFRFSLVVLFSLVRTYSGAVSSVFPLGCWGPGYIGLRPGKNGYLEKPTTAALALGAACSGIINTV